MPNKTLRRSATNQVIAGVCGGIGEYFDIDPSVVRIIFIVLAFATGSGIILYVILWLVIPGATSSAQTIGETTMREGFQEMGNKYQEVKSKIEQELKDEEKPQPAPTQTTTPSSNTGTNWLGVILILLGSWLFLKNFGFFRFFDIGRLWPIILIVIGVYVLIDRKK